MRCAVAAICVVFSALCAAQQPPASVRNAYFATQLLNLTSRVSGPRLRYLLGDPKTAAPCPNSPNHPRQCCIPLTAAVSPRMQRLGRVDPATGAIVYFHEFSFTTGSIEFAFFDAASLRMYAIKSDESPHPPRSKMEETAKQQQQQHLQTGVRRIARATEGNTFVRESMPLLSGEQNASVSQDGKLCRSPSPWVVLGVAANESAPSFKVSRCCLSIQDNGRIVDFAFDQANASGTAWVLDDAGTLTQFGLPSVGNLGHTCATSLSIKLSLPVRMLWSDFFAKQQLVLGSSVNVSRAPDGTAQLVRYTALLNSRTIVSWNISGSTASAPMHVALNYETFSIARAQTYDRNPLIWVSQFEVQNTTKFPVLSALNTSSLSQPTILGEIQRNASIAADVSQSILYAAPYTLPPSLATYSVAAGAITPVNTATLEYSLINRGMDVPQSSPKYCPNACSGLGACVAGTCSCDLGWTAPDCSCCDSTVWCNARGACIPDSQGERSCTCILTGWKGPRCEICDAATYCNGHGACPSDGESECVCETGFSGPHCKNCSSTLLCSGHGQCISNATSADEICLCDEHWVGPNCLEFRVTNELVVKGVDISTIAVAAIFFVALATSILAVFVAPPDSAFHANYANWVGVRALLLYFQSFALLMAWNDSVYHIFFTSFRWFHLFNADIPRTFDPVGVDVQYNFWATVGSCFVPKSAIFVIGVIIWIWMVSMWTRTRSHFWSSLSSRVRTVLLQFAMWLSFPFFVSAVGIFGSECGKTNVPGLSVGGSGTNGTIDTTADCGGSWVLPVMRFVSFALLCVIAVSMYRMWKELTLNAHWFDLAKSDHYAASVALDLRRLGSGENDEWQVQERARRERMERSIGSRFKRAFHYLFFPTSRLMNWFLLRLCTELEKEAQLRAMHDPSQTDSMSNYSANPPLGPDNLSLGVNEKTEKSPLLGDLGATERSGFIDDGVGESHRSDTEGESTEWEARRSAAEDLSQVKVEDFLRSVVKKLDGVSPEKHDIRPIVVMLRGNWYTTVADLRNLSIVDAEKLGIPSRLYKAMMVELFPRRPAGSNHNVASPRPISNQPSSYTTLQSLTVASEPKTAFLRVYGAVVDHYNVAHHLFAFDELILRTILWCVLVVCLSGYTLLQLALMMVFQVWYCGFLVFQQPYKHDEYLVSDLIPNVGLIVVIACMIVVALDNDSFIFLLVVAITHVMVALGALVPQAFLITKRERQRRRRLERGIHSVNDSSSRPLPSGIDVDYRTPDPLLDSGDRFTRMSFDRDVLVDVVGEERDPNLPGAF